MGLFDWFQRKPTRAVNTAKSPTADADVAPRDIIPFPISTLSDSPQICVGVRLTEKFLLATLLTGLELAIDFDQIDRVAVRTTDEGDWSPDVFWIISAGPSTCLIPQGISGEADLFNYLIRLPGFDKETMISAISSTENSEFECWKRDSEPSFPKGNSP